MRIRKIIFFCCSIFFAVCQVKGQIDPRQATACGYKRFVDQLIVEDPDYPIRKLQMATEFQSYIDTWGLQELFQRVSDIDLDPVVIPVVFHRVGNTAMGNSHVTDTEIRILLADLNDLFSNNSNATTFNGLGVNTDISFCLAAFDPLGHKTIGIENVPDQVLTHIGPFCNINISDDDAITSNTLASSGHSTWDVTRYLNIWLCDLSGCTDKSWGYTPDMYLSTSYSYRDGVVCDINSFDVKRMAHGIGHYLSLLHTFGNQGDCTYDDGCDDTPFSSGSASGISNCSNITQCSAENGTNHNVMGPSDRRLIEDYMDDSPLNCKTLFTLQQKTKMHLTLSPSHLRASLIDPNSIVQCDDDPTARCGDGRVDGGETGPDCGGPCPPCACKTVQFKINNRSTTNGEIVNVCPEQILIEADCPNGGAKFNAISTNGSGGNGVVLNVTLGLCDINGNWIGSPTNHWVNVGNSPPSYLDVNSNIKDYFNAGPYNVGFVFSPGQIYRLTLQDFGSGALNGGNSTYSALFRIFDGPNTNISNTNISFGRVGDYVSVTSSSIVPWMDYNIVAQSQIELLPSSAFQAGDFYIDNFDCSTISNYRTIMPENNTPASNINATASQTLTPSASGSKLSNENTAPSVNVIPNPFQGQCKIVIQNAGKYPQSISVQNVLGNTVVEYQNISSFENVVDLNDLPSGIYFVTVNFWGRTVFKKIIKE